MPDVKLRLDMRTSGGEVSDIVWNGRYAGVMHLVYRENERIMGNIQLDKQLLSASGKQEVIRTVRDYVEDLSDALNIEACDVQVVYSDAEQSIGMTQRQAQSITDIEPASPSYELVKMEETRNSVDYYLLDENSELIAEVMCRMRGREVSGSIDWAFDPLEEEMDAAIDLLTADFNEEDIDVFVWDMCHQGEVLDTIELTHEELLGEGIHEDFTIVLARDDGDVWTYEIYQQSTGGLPIGTATIDVSEPQLSGFMNFRENPSTQERNLIIQLLMGELDKEKDYKTLHVSMMVENSFIDEVLLDAEYVH